MVTSKTLESKLNGSPLNISEGELWRLFDNIYPPYRETLAQHIIKITGWEPWAIEVCNQRLLDSEKVSQLIALNKKSNKNARSIIMQTAANDNQEYDA